MYEIRFHGRGGQGAVTAANILAIAAFKEGYFVQSFPFFGVERRGAPVEAYTRIDNKKILTKMNIYVPDAVVVLDSSLLNKINPAAGLKKNGNLIINTQHLDNMKKYADARVATVDATSIAINHKLGSRASPIVNTAILGAYARVTGNVKLDYIKEAIRENVTQMVEENVSAAAEAYDAVKMEVLQ